MASGHDDAQLAPDRRLLPVLSESAGLDGQCGPVVENIDVDRLTVADLACQQRSGQRVADRGLDQPPQRAGTVDRVVAVDRQPFASGVGDIEREPPAGEPLCASARDLDVDDLRQLLGRRATSNTTMSSSRLRNSGLKCSRTTASTASRLAALAARIDEQRASRGWTSGRGSRCGSRPCDPARRSAGRRRAPAAVRRTRPGAPSRPRRAARRCTDGAVPPR